MSVAGEHILARFSGRDDGDGLTVGDIRFSINALDKEINSIHREIELARLKHNRVPQYESGANLPNE